jgi:hypothetical protein
MTEILDSWEFRDDPYEHFVVGDDAVIAKFYSAMEADVAAARLRSEGIPCFLSNTASQHVQTQVMNLVRLHVRKSDTDSAREILAETLPEPESSTGSVATGLLIILAIFLAFAAIVWLIKALLG